VVKGKYACNTVVQLEILAVTPQNQQYEQPLYFGNVHAWNFFQLHSSCGYQHND
jgi:hypothetical protein